MFAERNLVRAVSIIIVLVIAIALSGCTVTYSHDFVKNSTLSEGSLSWANLGSDYSFEDKGLYIEDASFSSPVSFTGDFECTFEVEIELPVSDTDYVDFAFFLINGTASSYDEFVGLDAKYFELITSRHTIIQGPDPEIKDERSYSPEFMEPDVNEFTVARAGDMVTVKVNGQTTWSFELAANNRAAYLRPFIRAFHSGFTVGAGFYLRKVAVRYEKGNSL